MNPNGDRKDRYIRIFSNMLGFPSKGIFSANQFHADDHFYEYKLCKIGVKQRLVKTDGREIRMFISDVIDYTPVRIPTDIEMDS